MLDCFKVLAQMIFCIFISRSNSVFSQVIDVTDYGAIGDGVTDSTQAFIKVWEIVCKSNLSNPVLNVPKGRTFLLMPYTFQGPCNSPKIHFQVRGQIVAPHNIGQWKPYRSWLWVAFEDVDGLTVDGGGVFDAKGAMWWEKVPDAHRRPTALSFFSCNNLLLNGLRHLNSAKNHISISGCTNATLTNLNIIAPAYTNNTDGVDVANSYNIQIQDSYIRSGDDCIALNSISKNINITGLYCGPGHGISIGSLGAKGEYAVVEGIHVENCIMNSTDNGARIKTWQGGSGYAKNIVFKNITLINVNNPIIIDQFYCPNSSCKNQTSAVKINDVTFEGFYGTSGCEEAINLSCCDSYGCRGISFAHINITPAVQDMDIGCYCNNAHGTWTDSNPKVDCLLP